MCYDRQICISALGHLVAQIDFQLGLFLFVHCLLN